MHPKTFRYVSYRNLKIINDIFQYLNAENSFNEELHHKEMQILEFNWKFYLSGIAVWFAARHKNLNMLGIQTPYCSGIDS